MLKLFLTISMFGTSLDSDLRDIYWMSEETLAECSDLNGWDSMQPCVM